MSIAVFSYIFISSAHSRKHVDGALEINSDFISQTAEIIHVS